MGWREEEEEAEEAAAAAEEHWYDRHLEYAEYLEMQHQYFQGYQSTLFSRGLKNSMPYVSLLVGQCGNQLGSATLEEVAANCDADLTR